MLLLFEYFVLVVIDSPGDQMIQKDDCYQE